MTTLAKADGVFDLQDHSVIKRGRQRDVYFLDAASGVSTDDGAPIVLKVPRYAEREKRQKWYKRILRKLRPSSALRIITKEANYYRYLMHRAQRRGFEPPIPEFIGYVNTSAGRGAIWQAILDPDGNLASTAADIARREHLSQLIEPLNRFAKTCFGESIVAPDLHLGNLACTERNGQREFILVDGFGDHRMISVRALWPAYNRRSLIRSFESMARKAKVRFDPETLAFELPDGE